MTTLQSSPTLLPGPLASIETLADLVESLGDIPLDRIRFRPLPGLATEADVIAADDHEDRLFELVDGILVEKAMGFAESVLAVIISGLLIEFVIPRGLGVVAGADGMMMLSPGLIRIPDVAFVAWDRFESGRLPTQPVPRIAPDLAIEVLSKSNTKREMDRKTNEYFQAGTRLVWHVDPPNRTVRVFVEPSRSILLTEADTLDGGDVLPGFSLPVGRLFAQNDRVRPFE